MKHFLKENYFHYNIIFFVGGYYETNLMHGEGKHLVG